MCIEEEALKCSAKVFLRIDLVGQLLGTRAPIEALKTWIFDNWKPLGVQLDIVQVFTQGVILGLIGYQVSWIMSINAQKFGLISFHHLHLYRLCVLFGCYHVFAVFKSSENKVAF